MSTTYAIAVGADGLTGATLTTLLTAGILTYGPKYPDGNRYKPRNNPDGAMNFNYHKKFNGYEGRVLSFVAMTYADWYRINGYCGDPAESVSIYIRCPKWKGGTSSTAEQYADYSGVLHPPEAGYPIIGGRGDVVLEIDKMVYIQAYP